MPFKSKEVKKEYQRKLMAQRRAQTKGLTNHQSIENVRPKSESSLLDPNVRPLMEKLDPVSPSIIASPMLVENKISKEILKPGVDIEEEFEQCSSLLLTETNLEDFPFELNSKLSDFDETNFLEGFTTETTTQSKEILQLKLQLINEDKGKEELKKQLEKEKGSVEY